MGDQNKNFNFAKQRELINLVLKNWAVIQCKGKIKVLLIVLIICNILSFLILFNIVIVNW